MSKNILRRSLIEKRLNLSVESKKEKSGKIIKTLENMEIFQRAKTIFCYISNKDEVQTHDLIKKYLIGKKIIVPKVTSKNGLKFLRLRNWKNLQKGFCDILEPINDDEEINASKIELSIIPGVGFDRSGHRIGYGKGYYDRLLKKISTPKIGLAYHGQIVDRIPAKPHDQKVAIIVTEEKIIQCL
ncbi:5-formyltetrahydrofolate cyclo-ligase [Candidatus Peregrinibacteria bacterium]|nr:5-formyltetrahydrofolate cyclo-ligase [Candidatus Peregrinibacteria bacterium]